MKLLSLLLLLISGTSFGMGLINVELAEFKIHPEIPTQGLPVTILILPERFTGDIELKTVVEAIFEGTDAPVEDLGNDIWKFSSPVLNDLKTYQLSVRVFIEDKVQAQITRKEIQKLTRDIEKLKIEILLEPDEEIRERLALEIEEKEGHKEHLQDFLPSLRRLLGEENFQFNVTAGQGL